MALASGGRLPLGRRFASAERRSRESQLLLNRRCERVRTTEHAPRRPRRVLERIHGLTEIVKRGLVVVVELSPAPRRRSVDSSRFETTRPSSRRLRAPPTGVRDTVLSIIESSCPSGDRVCTHWLRGLVCVVRSFRSRARAGVATLRTHCSAALFLGNETALAHARGNDSLRMVAARASSSFQTSRQQLSWLNSLFARDRAMSSVMEPI